MVARYMLADSAAGGTEIDCTPAASSQSEGCIALQRTRIEFTPDLAKRVFGDGEGATKFIAICFRLRGASSYPAGRHIASMIAHSVLLKTALFGRGAAWGNVMTALGLLLMDTKFAGKGIIVPERTSVSFVPVDSGGVIKILDGGVPAKADEARAGEIMEAEEDVEVVVDLRDDGVEGEMV